MKSLYGAVFGLAVILSSGISVPANGADLLSQAKAVAVETIRIEQFRIGRDQNTFGMLTFLGGLEITSKDRNVGGISGLLCLGGGSTLLAVTDNGLWLAARLKQDDRGTPLDVHDARYAPLRGTKGETLKADWRHDTEALTTDGRNLFVAAERTNEVYRYPWPLSTGTEKMVQSLPMPPGVKALRGNKGLEALAAGWPGSPSEGRLIGVAERGVQGQQHLPAFILSPGNQGAFTIARSGRYDATDAAFLPDGDLLLLERRFNLRDLIGMRLRRFDGMRLEAGAYLEGEVLLEADFSDQIDNMEALAVHQTADGRTIVTLLSDNNRSLLQRNILLRFELKDR